MSSRTKWLAAAFMLLPLVTEVDFLTGFEFQYSIFYLVSICLTTWFGSWRIGVVVALVSVIFSLLGDLASGVQYKNHFVPWWNCVITLSFYLAMVWSLNRLRSFQRQLEARVLERTSALTQEIQERKSLEQALLDVSEREQRRIGHDLHDSLCQHLTSAALAGQVLGDKLRHKNVEEAADCDQLVGIIEDGIDLARSLARGLAPVEQDVLGLTAALRELARTTTVRTRIRCTFEDSAADVRLEDAEAVTHLFRIAQEAVNNAVRHSSAQHIRIFLSDTPQGLELRVEDDGVGLPTPPQSSSGMGLRIMRHRSSMIGATCKVGPGRKGVSVTVVLPLSEVMLD